MPRRKPIDVPLKLTTKPVTFLNGQTSTATVEGNNASWDCACGKRLIGRCYYQFGNTCYTVCPNPNCNKKFRVHKDANKKVSYIEEFK